MPLENLALSPQCGFASTSAGNVLTPDEQKAKLALVAETAARSGADRAAGDARNAARARSPVTGWRDGRRKTRKGSPGTALRREAMPSIGAMAELWESIIRRATSSARKFRPVP